MLGHLVATTRFDFPALRDPERARWLWPRLQALVPDALGAALMPTHAHLFAELRVLVAMRRSVACLLGAFAREHDLGELWMPIEAPQAVTTLDKRWRMARYLHLNPCRPSKLAGEYVQLARDPLDYPWTTHRDVLGMVTEPWVDAKRLAHELGADRRSFEEEFHRYVSSDPHVAADGTPLPRLLDPDAALAPLGLVEQAACMAWRSSCGELHARTATRTTFVALAWRHGWRDVARLASRCACRPAAIRRMVARCPERWRSAADRCLAHLWNRLRSNDRESIIRPATIGRSALNDRFAIVSP
jgi:hypothetical protein